MDTSKWYGTITTPSSPTSGITGLGVGANTFRWTIINGPCSASVDEVVITRNATPTTSNAGPDQTGAATCGLTSVTLAANTPVVGTGLWTIVSGTGGTITTPTSPTSTFTGTAGTAYVLRWTISNAPCPPSTNDVNITFNQNPTTSNAGTDQTVCSTTATLAGNAPSIGTGTWTRISGTGTITTPSSPTSGITGLGVGANTFRWTIINGPCSASVDEVVITRTATPTTSNAGSDQIICISGSATLTANTPTVGIGVWSISNGPNTSITQFSSPSSPITVFTPTDEGTYILVWSISNPPCLASSDNVTVTVNGPPTITLATNPSVCRGITSANLPYSSTTGSPNQYSIDYDATANGAGFTDITNATLGASPIVLAVPAAVPPATYNATLTVRNSSTGCVSTTYPITVTSQCPSCPNHFR